MSVTSPAAPNPVAEVPEPKSPILTAPLTNSFDYTRSLGPVLSQFALALRDGRIIGSKGSDGKVSVPPVEFDPVTGTQSAEFVEVSTVGTVTTWTWNPEPVPGQPLDTPFAWALIRLDGADTTLLHAVSTDSPDDLSTGLRVHAPQGAEAGLLVIPTPVSTAITHSANEEESVYLEGLKAGKLIGTRIGSGVDAGRVYFPPRGVSPADGSPASERVELAHTGIVTTLTSWESDYGYPPKTVTLLVVHTDCGHLLKWQGTVPDEVDGQRLECGQRVTIARATVKAHEQWKGTPQTRIVRAKLIRPAAQ